MKTKIEWNKVTWYSKLLAVVLFTLTFYIGFQLGIEKGSIPNSPNKTEEKQTVVSNTISISNQEIKEENFTGKVAVVNGTGLLKSTSTDFITKTLNEFRAQANKEVPEMRKQFGSDNPTSIYTINIDAKYLKNPKTESLVIEVYTFTGGAHGSSYYKVFTLLKDTQKILSISDIVRANDKEAFVSSVKNKLLKWRTEGNTESPLFPDTVKALILEDFSNWSIDENNLTIYFSQYAIGPGVLGQVAFPVPVSEIKSFLTPGLI